MSHTDTDSTLRGSDLLGAPFDSESTLGWPGSRYAPQKVREAIRWINMRIQDGQIYQLEDDTIHTVGNDLLRDLGDLSVLPKDTEATFRTISDAVGASLQRGRSPIVIGGDDSLLFPVARGVHDALPGRIGIIHFDAHLDLMDESAKQGRYSQSSGMRRSLEMARVDYADCIQLCERHFNFPASGRFKHEHGLAHISAREAIRLGAAATVQRALEHVAGADHLFLSFDIDAIDPAHAPGCGAHEPGGISSDQALEMVELLAPHCAAMAITEVNPMLDVRDTTATLAAYLAFTFAVAGRNPVRRRAVAG
ncbi:arginase [Corticimicrobacter populi]|uniref:Arginase n=2 Tax=Corticimicrobacter populi TaxID=2175229 RepID=A0A2V1K828_9BURK|nr:arginase [Corticimicrobacter populi]